MSKEMIFTAKTVAEAVKQATEVLHVEESALEYTILEEGKKGFLGIGAQDAKISVLTEENGVDAAVSFVKQLIADMGLNLSVDVHPGHNEDMVIDAEGEGAGLLIGHHGETLDALQYLANLAANKADADGEREHIRITVDIEKYRAKREESLRALARRMASKVVKYKKSVMLEPMNPYERRIIHSEIQHIDGVSTNSIGAENNRRVVIFLEDGENNQ